MLSVNESPHAEPSSPDNEASVKASPPNQADTTSVPARSGNPRLLALTATPPRPLPPTVAHTHVRRSNVVIGPGGGVTANQTLGECLLPEASVNQIRLQKAVSDAHNVISYEEIPGFVDSIARLPKADQTTALGELANQLFSLNYLGSHDFARICENFHHLPWPPAAASGLLGKIGWITPEAHASLDALRLGASVKP
jgi:hypothetical protein